MAIPSGRRWTSTFLDFIVNSIVHESLHILIDDWEYDNGSKSGIDYWTDRGWLP